ACGGCASERPSSDLLVRPRSVGESVRRQSSRATLAEPFLQMEGNILQPPFRRDGQRSANTTALRCPSRRNGVELLRCTRQHDRVMSKDRIAKVGPIALGAGWPLTVIAGPCV